MNDEYGKKLLVTEIAIADEFAAAAELVMGKTLKNPVAIIRGYEYETLSIADDDDFSIKHYCAVNMKICLETLIV